MTKVKSRYSSSRVRNRFLPATKTMAKEMLLIVDKPAINNIVEEAPASGIEDILIVTGVSQSRTISTQTSIRSQTLKQKERQDY